jgi:hypothetical protein
MRRMLLIAVPLVLALASCSTTSDPTATYTGSACDYDGPSEFDLDSTVTFTVINESDTTNMGFGVWSVPEGTTADEIAEEGLFELLGISDVDDWPGFYTALFAPTPIDGTDARGGPLTMKVFLDTPGQHALNCFDAAADLDYPIMFTVSDN